VRETVGYGLYSVNIVERCRMDVKGYVRERASAAKEAWRTLAMASTRMKNDALMAMADALARDAEKIQRENARDLEEGRAKGLSTAMLDRLALTEERIADMAGGLREIAALPDPVGAVDRMNRRPSGIDVARMRVPIGVVGIIYESRPNVTADAAGLCLKAGDAAVLRGGSEAIRSNRCLAEVLSGAATGAGIPTGVIQMIEITDRQAVTEMARAEGLIDLIVPRGGKGLIHTIVENARMPVLKHYEGVCHVYVDDEADLEMAAEIALNAKVQRPGVCNAMETLLVHAAVAEDFLPGICRQLAGAGVELRGCERVRAIMPEAEAATEEDWYTEYLDLILTVKVVDDMEQAVAHITQYGSAHTDAIVTRDYLKARRFVMAVDSSSVMVNASTRLSDGGVYGLGAEIGISTDKLHARGPMGVEELTTYKWVVYGEGAIRE